MTLAALGNLNAANPLTVGGASTTGAEAGGGDFTQLMVDVQAGQATAASSASSTWSASAAGQPVTPDALAAAAAQAMPDGADNLVNQTLAVAMPASSTDLKSCRPDSGQPGLVMTALPGMPMGSGASASPVARAAEATVTTAADATPDSEVSDPARQAADLLALLGLPAAMNQPVPTPAASRMASAGAASADAQVAATGIMSSNGLVAASESPATSGSANLLSSPSAAPQGTAADLSLAELLKPAANAPAPLELARAAANLAEGASRRAGIQTIESGGSANAAASFTLTPLAQATGVVTTQAAAPTAATVSVQLPGHLLNDPGWSDTFRERVALLASQGVQHASIRVTPEGMGPIQVHIAMADQGAQVEFKAQHHATAALIESMLPRLAHAMESQGIKLDDARVSAFTRQDEAALQSSLQQDGRQAASQQTGNGERRFAATLGEAGGDTTDSVSAAPVAPRRSQPTSNLDAYA